MSFKTHFAETVRVTKIGYVDDAGPLTYIEAVNEDGGRSEWMLNSRTMLDLRDQIDSALHTQMKREEPLYEYTIDDGEGPWVSDALPWSELSEGQQDLAATLTAVGEVVKLYTDRADIKMERVR